MSRKIIKEGMYVFTISFDILYFIKNKTDRVNKRKIPSERTIVQSAAKINDRIISFLPYFKKITKDEIPNIINSGSVIPRTEFIIIRGSNAKSAPPTNEIFSSKNFLQRN